MSRAGSLKASVFKRPTKRTAFVAVLLLGCAGGGFALGQKAGETLFPPEAPDRVVPTTSILLESLTVNIPGRGTMTFNARVAVPNDGSSVDGKALRDAALMLATTAGAMPIVRQSDKVIPAMNRAVSTIAPGHGFETIELEDAALFATGI